MPSPLFRRFFGTGMSSGRYESRTPAKYDPKTERERGNLVSGVAKAIGVAIGKVFGRAVAQSMEPAVEKIVEQGVKSGATRRQIQEEIEHGMMPTTPKRAMPDTERRATSWTEDAEYLPVIEGPINVTSSNVHSIAYEHNQNDSYAPGNLLVRYLGGDSKNRSGEGPLYRYHDVPVTIWKSFKLAASKGSFVWSELRVRGTISGHQYAYELAGTGDSNYVPRQAGLKRGKQGEWYMNRKFGDMSSTLPERQARGARGDLTKDFNKRAAEMKLLKAGRR